jgi:hypothetical protein
MQRKKERKKQYIRVNAIAIPDNRQPYFLLSRLLHRNSM